MTSQRTKDRLVGAVLALGGVVLLVAAALLAFAWWVSEPAGGTASPRPGTGASAGDGSPSGQPAPPRDLGPDETWLGDLALDAGTLVSADATLRDVVAVGQDARTGADGTVVGQLEVQATVPFDVVARELGGGSVVSAAEDGQAAVTRDVVLAGRSFSVVATGTVEVADGLVVVEPRSVDVGGPAFLADAVAALAREFVTIEQEVEGLPDGLVLQDVEVRQDGFRVWLDGEDVALG